MKLKKKSTFFFSLRWFTFGHAENSEKSQQLGRDGRLREMQGKDAGADKEKRPHQSREPAPARPLRREISKPALDMVTLRERRASQRPPIFSPKL